MHDLLPLLTHHNVLVILTNALFRVCVTFSCVCPWRTFQSLLACIHADPLFPLRLYDFSFSVYCRAKAGSCSLTRDALAKAHFSQYSLVVPDILLGLSDKHTVFERIALGRGVEWGKALNSLLNFHSGSSFEWNEMCINHARVGEC